MGTLWARDLKDPPPEAGPGLPWVLQRSSAVQAGHRAAGTHLLADADAAEIPGETSPVVLLDRLASGRGQ